MVGELGESYHASMCGIDSRIHSIGLDHDTITRKRSIPDVCEGASAGRVVVKDLNVPRPQPAATGWQGTLVLLGVVHKLWLRALINPSANRGKSYSEM